MQLARPASTAFQISPTAAVIAGGGTTRAQGVDLADFGPGEPDFPTPEHIKHAAIRALERKSTRNTRPTAGIMPLREAICNWHATRTRLVLRASGMHHQRRRQARHLQRRLARCCRRAMKS